jgi:DNA polymerase-3 subunit delta'
LFEEQLISAIERKNIPHACILSAVSGNVAASRVRGIAARICLGLPNDARLDECPDYIVLDAPKVGDIRALILELSQRPFSEGYRVAALYRADAMTIQAQNALLKTLETPPERTVFLLVGRYSAFLPTIRSRCVAVTVKPPAEAELIRMLEQQGITGASRICEAAGADPELALRFAESPELMDMRIKTLDMFDEMLSKKCQPLTMAAYLYEDKQLADLKLTLMLGYARDILLCALSCSGVDNKDRTKIMRAHVKTFTAGQINGIIESLADAKRRLAGNTNIKLLMDALLLDISEVI